MRHVGSALLRIGSSGINNSRHSTWRRSWSRIKKEVRYKCFRNEDLANKFRSNTSPNNTIPQAYLSKIGAFNGSGFGLGTTIVDDPDGQIELYFQHHTGEIRYLIRNTN